MNNKKIVENKTTDKKEFGEEYSSDSLEDVSVTNEAERVVSGYSNRATSALGTY